ncbi:MAG: aconitate hydratase AcnA [Deltaproteobacteria bacterium]|nr:aconitate hydratase AcnA [Deltaproteobacteria bacterium]
MSQHPQKGLQSCLVSASVDGLGKYFVYSLPEYAKTNSLSLGGLPYCIRHILECLLRNFDPTDLATQAHLNLFNSYTARAKSDLGAEINFWPGRIVLQDFTGVPVLIDLATIRDQLVAQGVTAETVNPQIPCHLIIDHSIQVDYWHTNDALEKNELLDFQRNKERYEFLKWADKAFSNLTIIPPNQGIIHQLNLERLSPVLLIDENKKLLYPDSCIGTDSHTTMINGLGVLGWGVGGIEAEAVMLGESVSLNLPQVVGVELTGDLAPGSSITDVALEITATLRKTGIVSKFVEFYGEGLNRLSVFDRATISNMCPEYGSTVAFFPFDEQVVDFLRLRGESEDKVTLVDRYFRSQYLYRDSSPVAYDQTISIDLAKISPLLSGPKKPHQKQSISTVAYAFNETLITAKDSGGYGLPFDTAMRESGLNHGDIVIAAITSCTNTANPRLMITAALLAKNAIEKGLKPKEHIKKSLAPGSVTVSEYLRRAGLLQYLEQLGFNIVSYSCSTCIGNSGPLLPKIEAEIKKNNLVVTSVISGNRNFEGRVHPLVKANYLTSPALVVAYSLLGTITEDITEAVFGYDKQGNSITLTDIFPKKEEVEALLKNLKMTGAIFAKTSANSEQVTLWENLTGNNGKAFSWPDSTYIKKSPFITMQTNSQINAEKILVSKANVLAVFGDNITTDHISPAGSISKNSPAGRFLKSKGTSVKELNTYGARRGNHEVMVRGAFANAHLRNLLCTKIEGNFTNHFPSMKQMSIYDAAENYKASSTPLIIIAGKNYGTGSSRDWAAKAVNLLRVKCVLAESFERIHRSNLVYLGVIPIEFIPDENFTTLGLKGDELFDITFSGEFTINKIVDISALGSEGKKTHFHGCCRVDTQQELRYYLAGGILNFLTSKLMK